MGSLLNYAVYITSKDPPPQRLPPKPADKISIDDELKKLMAEHGKVKKESSQSL